MSSAIEAGATTRHADQQIRDDIAAAIFEQRLVPGMKLSEARLGEIYAVSRTVARKALFQLASDKLVDIRPNRGAAVAKPTIDEARQVFEARRVVEAALVTRAVARLTDADRRHLQELIDADAGAHSDGDRPAGIRLSGRFHRALAGVAGNDVLASVLDELIGRTSLIIAMYGSEGISTCSHTAHAELLACLGSGDAEAAQNAMRAHLADCEAQLDLAPARQAAELSEVLGRAGNPSIPKTDPA